MERILHVEWKRTPLRRIAKEVLSRVAGEVTVDEWGEYAAEGRGRTYRVIFEEVAPNRFNLGLQLEEGDEGAMNEYQREMESAILKGGGFVR